MAASVRAIGMSEARLAIGDDQLAERLTVEVPGAIVRGEPLPPRPVPRPPGLLSRLLWR